MTKDKDMFNKLQQEQRDLDASYRQSLQNKKEHETRDQDQATRARDQATKGTTSRDQEEHGPRPGTKGPGPRALGPRAQDHRERQAWTQGPNLASPAAWAPWSLGPQKAQSPMGPGAASLGRAQLGLRLDGPGPPGLR